MKEKNVSPLFTKNMSISISKNNMLDNHRWSREVTLMKISSGQGIVKPPIGWSNPNSSSDLLSRAWNEGWLKYETGTTYLFFWLSPTYTSRNPFGAAEVALLLVATERERPRIFFAPNRFLTKAILYFFGVKVRILMKLLKMYEKMKVIGYISCLLVDDEKNRYCDMYI